MREENGLNKQARVQGPQGPALVGNRFEPIRIEYMPQTGTKETELNRVTWEGENRDRILRNSYTVHQDSKNI